MTKWGMALLLLIASTAVSAGTTRQSPPLSFGGRWTLTSITPERKNYEQFWFGTDATVEQTATSLKIIRNDPPPRREAAFTIGAEARNDYVIAGGRRIIRDSRATLSRGTLLISTDTTEPDGQRWLS